MATNDTGGSKKTRASLPGASESMTAGSVLTPLFEDARPSRSYMNRCLVCRWHHRAVAGLRSQCRHPEAIRSPEKLRIKGSKHGVAIDEFNWPFGYEPIWLRRCFGFEEITNDSDQ
jgi:hypothetical protein